MKNVTLETLFKGMSPFALAILLSTTPAAAASEMKEGAKEVKEGVQEMKEGMKDMKAEHHKNAKHHGKHHGGQHHGGNPNAPADHTGEQPPAPEAEVVLNEGGKKELEDVYAN